MDRKDLLIVIPACNEEDSITKVLDQLESARIGELGDILIINDASSDATAKIVRSRGLELITNIFRLGYGGAVQVGYKYAARTGYQYVIQLDGDGQHDVCNIPALYRRLLLPDENGNLPDIVLGSRFLDGSRSFPISRAKRMAFPLFRQMIFLLTGKAVADPTTGLQGLNRNAFAHYAQYTNFDDKYPDANMLIQMLLLGFRVAEIPAIMHPRTAGKSIHSGWKPLWYMFRMLFSIAAIVFRIRVLKIEKGAHESHARGL